MMIKNKNSNNFKEKYFNKLHKKTSKNVFKKWLYKQSYGLTIKRKIYNKLLRIIFTADIPINVKIGKNVIFTHNGLGVVINDKSIIGNETTIFPHVTLGSNEKIDKDGLIINQGAPILEDRVIIFTGACVLGPVTIGHDSYVGANAVVTKDVPPQCICVGHNVIKKQNLGYHLRVRKG